MIYNNRIVHSKFKDRSNRRTEVDRAFELLNEQPTVKHKVVSLIESYPGASMVAFAMAGGVVGWLLSRKK